mmetsp:Transcript_22647/g.73250  ORF Transcript_22647/g.73250 Transcript_22647/m.73250 type:complete len:380 (-) Transcript_22647:441-1580(-)
MCRPRPNPSGGLWPARGHCRLLVRALHPTRRKVMTSAMGFGVPSKVAAQVAPLTLTPTCAAATNSRFRRSRGRRGTMPNAGGQAPGARSAATSHWAAHQPTMAERPRAMALKSPSTSSTTCSPHPNGKLYLLLLVVDVPNPRGSTSAKKRRRSLQPNINEPLTRRGPVWIFVPACVLPRRRQRRLICLLPGCASAQVSISPAGHFRGMHLHTQARHHPDSSPGCASTMKHRLQSRMPPCVPANQPMRLARDLVRATRLIPFASMRGVLPRVMPSGHAQSRWTTMPFPPTGLLAAIRRPAVNPRRVSTRLVLLLIWRAMCCRLRQRRQALASCTLTRSAAAGRMESTSSSITWRRNGKARSAPQRHSLKTRSSETCPPSR